MTRDLRKYAQQTNVRLFVGFLLILFLVGDGLIYGIYGRQAAALGLVCILLGLAPLVLIGFSLWVIDWFVKRMNKEE
jgi:hypothetical protein